MKYKNRLILLGLMILPSYSFAANCQSGAVQLNLYCNNGNWQVVATEAQIAKLPKAAQAKLRQIKKNSKSSGNPFQDCVLASSSVSTTCSSASKNISAEDYNADTSKDAQSMSAQEKQNTSEICKKSAERSKEASSTLSEVSTSCEQAIEQCSNSCSTVDISKLNASQKEQFDKAKEACSEGPSLLSSLKEDKTKADNISERSQKCVSDTTGGKGFEMPQFPMPGQDDQNKEAEKLKEDCTNTTFAAQNEACKCLAGNCNKKDIRSDPALGAEASLDQSIGGSSDSPTGVTGKKLSYESQREAMNLPQSGGGGGGGGSASGANQAGIDQVADESKINTKINGGARGGSGGYSVQGAHTAQVGAGNGTYSPVGSWIPPKLKETDMDRFRPGVGRKPTAAADQGVLRGSHENFWSVIHTTYCDSYSLSCEANSPPMNLNKNK